ncbi:hypothetical protein [Cytophaga sp. FL35]|uniref:hypothetical protein n=1 Tax=Cytophaga sp. FL35 TaxID=1904456 RepID=UPI0016535F50|nr:hypothetical protein [Cytophaga sp. FL35]MBC7000864.1 hypothetical protein [Cytophaga sp. FL35]
MKNILILTIVMSLISCEIQRKIVKDIEFEAPYKFNIEIENQVTSDSNSGHAHHGNNYQHLAYDYGLKGDYKNALRLWDLGYEAQINVLTQEQIDSINNSYRVTSATDYIFSKAEQSQVIIINEAHHNSRHRAFTKSLLKKLFTQGYKNLGLEALSNGKNKDSLLNHRGYPILKSGYYILDPQFGDLVRTALEIGYNIFPYEVTTEADGKEREIEQARNIQNEIEKKPNQKFIIHCGFDHALEGKLPAWGKAMAGRLNEFTGINPFTINQTEYSERSNKNFNNFILRALDLKEPSILLDQLNNPMRYERKDSWTDIAVLHPNTNYSNGRPDWLFLSDVKEVPITLEDMEIAPPIMVLAYKKNEDINKAIPVDIVEIKDIKDKINLALKKGTYQIVIINQKKVSRKFEISVE